MQHPNYGISDLPAYVSHQDGARDDEIDLMKIFSVARRQWKLLLIGLVVGAAIGFAYVATTTPVYTARIDISLDTPEAANTRNLSGIQESVVLDEGQITTEIEVIQSEAISRKVVEELNLTENALFLANRETGTSRLISGLRNIAAPLVNVLRPQPEDDGLLPLSEEDRAAARLAEAVTKLQGNMAVSRVRGSRILQVSYTAMSPSLAARIANGIADVYINDQLEAKYDANERATNWLRDRAEQLRAQSNALDSSVEQFKQENGLIGISGSSNVGTELERVAQQVSNAQADLLALEARLERLDDIVERGDTTAAVSATATQSITSDLRSRFLDTLKEYNSLVSRIGEEHEQSRRLATELEQLQELLFEEIKRFAEVTANDVQVARERLVNLQKSRDELEIQLGADNEVLVELRELERNADTVRSLYSNFLERYQTSLQQQSFPVSDVRVINPAKIPGTPSDPRATRILALATILGFMVAAGYILIRELLDNKIRTEEQIRSALGMEFLGGLPLISPSRKRVLDIFKPSEALGHRQISFSDMLRYAVNKPLSSFSETLRSGKMAITLRRVDKHGLDAPKTAQGNVVGVVSCFPGEGKTTVSANLATLLAKQGSSVILIDADLRNSGLTRSITGDVSEGIIDVLTADANWRDIYYEDEETGVHVLPSRLGGRVVHTSEIVGGPAMGLLMQDLRRHYDYVIVDLPPLGPVIDARAALQFLDGIFFVIKWGATNVRFIQNILQSDPRLQEKSYGAFLNMFDPKTAHQYGSYAGSHYYSYGYTKYYTDR